LQAIVAKRVGNFQIYVVSLKNYIEENGEDKLEKQNEKVIEQRSLLDNIWRKKNRWLGHVLRYEGLLKAIIEGQLPGKLKGRKVGEAGLVGGWKGEIEYAN
jgi:hypothetical protein